MSKQLYEEALAEVRQLKQIAEDNAKKAIMEEVTPRIKQLIESQLLEAASGSTLEEDDSVEEVAEPVEEVADADSQETNESQDEKVFEVTPVVEGILKKMVKSHPRRLNEFRLLTYKLGRKVCEVRNPQVGYGDLLETMKTVYVLLQENIEPSEERQKIEETLDKYYQLALTKQENVKMNLGRGRKLDEASLKVDIDGLPDDMLDGIDWDENPPTVTLSPAGEEEEEMGGEEAGEESAEGEESGEEMDFGGDDQGDMGGDETEESYHMEAADDLDEDTVVEIDESMLRREIARMKKLRESKAEKAVEKKSVAGKKMTPQVLSAFGGGKEEGDPWLDGDVTTESLDEMDSLDDCSEEAFGDDVDESGSSNSQSRDSASVPTPGARAAFESRNHKLQEARQAAVAAGRKARRVMESARKAGNKAVFEGAKKAYAAASNNYAKATSAMKALQESVKRSSNSSAPAATTSNGETAALRKQLAETNLFNAKLLYTNKLLQNDVLTPRQKVSIIEKLDEARSLREAKLVYESLTRTLTSGKERISEGADRQVLGSASRATRPGSTVSLNEGYEAARWAKLAGISK